jgi:hypothetical protein
MGRQASEVLWLTLENEAGEVTRMGVTPTHPLFIAGTGWGDAGALVPGDAIRDKDLLPLTVLAVEVDPKPQMVHNLEIADAHTYFAGELEAWGHNSRYIPNDVVNQAKCIAGGKCEYCGTKLNPKPGFPDSLNLDHIDNYAGGGTSKDIRNIACSCRTCNLRKGTKNILEFFELLGR